MTAPHLGVLLGINLIFGFNLIASKYGMGQLPPLFFTALRFALVAAVLWPLLRLPRPQLGLILQVALAVGVLHFGLMYLGLALADDVSTVAIALQMVVPFTTLLSIVMLGERVGWRRTLGMALAFGGVMLIAFDPRVMGYLGALVLVLLGGLAMAFGTILMKRLSGVKPLELQAWIGVVGAPALLLVSLVVERGQLEAARSAAPLVWLAVAFSALGASVIAHGALYWLIQRYEVSLISPLMLLSTVFSVVFGVWLMGDVLTPAILLGGVATLAGVAVIAVRSGGRVKRDPLDTLAPSRRLD